jgi:predicted PurR-regulated permease PerM
VDAPGREPPESATTDRPDDRDDHRFWVRVGGLLLLAGLLYLVWRIIEPLWQPLLWAVLLGALLAPVNQRLTRRLRGRVRLASTVTLLLSVLVVLLPLAMVTGAVGLQAAHLLQTLDRYVPDTKSGVPLDLATLPWIGDALGWVEENSHVSLAQLQEWILAGSKRLLEMLMSSGGSMVMGAVGVVVSLLLMLFVLFFVLRDGPAVAKSVIDMLPITARRRDRLMLHLGDTTRAVFVGIGLTALVQGMLVGIGFWIAGLPSPLVFSVVGVIAALIPMLGAALVWAPGAAYLALQGDLGHAIFLAIWGVAVISMVDNFLRPMLISGRAEVPTLAVFVGVMGGLAAFGFVGLFIGPIVLGVVVALFRFESEEVAARRGAHQ